MMSPDVPQPPEFVRFFHAEDGRHYPALVLEEADVMGPEPVAEDQPAPLPKEVVLHLQVFRPRGNMWVRAIHGKEHGQWTWYWEDKDRRDDPVTRDRERIQNRIHS
jgi:hypothetical protein